mmetsp:Transcript_10092/g.21814  ORF Transcript_10092/g.21814 Transcript_10092/m.21814 type:complete len:225 (+) Transcript_10092:151-825(+)
MIRINAVLIFHELNINQCYAHLGNLFLFHRDTVMAVPRVNKNILQNICNWRTPCVLSHQVNNQESTFKQAIAMHLRIISCIRYVYLWTISFNNGPSNTLRQQIDEDGAKERTHRISDQISGCNQFSRYKINVTVLSLLPIRIIGAWLAQLFNQVQLYNFTLSASPGLAHSVLSNFFCSVLIICSYMQVSTSQRSHGTLSTQQRPNQIYCSHNIVIMFEKAPSND